MNASYRLALIGAAAVLVLAACGHGDSSNSSVGGESSDGSGQPTKPVPTMLVVDGSGSMNTADAPGPRIVAAKTAATTLVGGLADDTQLGLMTYGTSTGSAPQDKAAGCRDVKVLVPLGPLDRGRVKSAIAGIVASGYTPLSLALQQAVQQLPPGDSPQAVVLVSDGQGTCDVSPCDTARQLKAQRPGLTISTVGFRLAGDAADQLSCIAQATGGLFVTADNTEQLTARLKATQNLGQAKGALTGSGLTGIELGQHIGDIRAAHPDFPSAPAQGTVQVIWHDCGWTFTDGMLTEIAPHDGGHTIDGIGPGTPLSRATELYGKPIKVETDGHGGHRLTYSADPNTDASYRMIVENYSNTGGTISGTIKTIVLCTCKPHNAATGAGPVATFDGYGPVRIGMTQAEVAQAMGQVQRGHFHNCTQLGATDGTDLWVWISDATGLVTGISTPAGTVTDRGVGDGSTGAEIRSAYSDSRFTIDEGAVEGQRTPGINVYDGPKGGDRLLAFSLDGNRAGQPSIGMLWGAEGC